MVVARDAALPNGFANDRANGFANDRANGFANDRADGFANLFCTFPCFFTAKVVLRQRSEIVSRSSRRVTFFDSKFASGFEFKFGSKFASNFYSQLMAPLNFDTTMLKLLRRAKPLQTSLWFGHKKIREGNFCCCLFSLLTQSWFSQPSKVLVGLWN